MDGALVSPSEDIEKLDRPTGITSGRAWAGLPARMHVSDPQLSLLFLLPYDFMTAENFPIYSAFSKRSTY